jgi:hypothetical protein
MPNDVDEQEQQQMPSAEVPGNVVKEEKMFVAEALGTLIATANPYLKAGGTSEVGRTSEARGLTMHFLQPNLGADGVPVEKPVSLTDINLEEDSRYPGEWMFKGQPQKIHKALRIQYRYPKRGHNGKFYMVTDYLLIGFEGTNGG